MEILKRTVEEVYGYKAMDGTMFSSEEECKEYEKSALMAAYSNFCDCASESYNGSSFHDQFCIGYEDDVRVVDIKDANILQIVNTYLKSRSRYCDAIPTKYIGTKCLISLWEDDGCAVIGTRKEMEDVFSELLDGVFGKKEVQEVVTDDDQEEDWFGIVRWCDADIANALEENGHEVNDENIAKVRNRLNTHWFTDHMIEAGWDYINDVIWKVIEDDD